MISLLNYVQELAVGLEREGRYAASQSYFTLLNSLREFSREGLLSVDRLNVDFVKRYEMWLFGKDCCRNTVSLYMRIFRSICRQAVDSGLMECPDKLFQQVFTGYDSCEKRAVSAGVISDLAGLELVGGSGVFFARDLFLLSFYLRGIPFIDLAHLRKSDIRNGILYYRRSKTGQLLTITLEPWAVEIINRYKGVIPGSVYLLPIIKRPLEEDEYKQYESALRLYNKRLHKLSALLGLEKNLTSYVARHSWATLAYHEGISVSEISAGLSHTSEQVTYAYLESFNADALAEVNLQVVALVNLHARKRWESGNRKVGKGKQKTFRLSGRTGTFTMQRNK